MDAHYRPADTSSLPTPERLLADIDARLKTQADDDRDALVEAIREPIPSRSGRTRASVRGTVTSHRLGYTVKAEVGTPGKSGERAHVVRFLQGGTGTRGGHGRIKKGHRGFIRGANVTPKGRGQRAQKVWTRGLKNAQQIKRAANVRMQAAWDAVTSEIRGNG